MLKALATMVAFTVAPMVAAAQTTDYFNFSIYTDANDPYITNLGTGVHSVIGTFSGVDGVLSEFSGTFTAPLGSWALTSDDLKFFSGSYDTVSGALSSLTFRFYTEVGEAGYYAYTFGAGSGEPYSDTLSFKKTGVSGFQTTELTANWDVSAVPEMDRGGFASVALVFLAGLGWMWRRRGQSSGRLSALPNPTAV